MEVIVKLSIPVMSLQLLIKKVNKIKRN